VRHPATKDGKTMRTLPILLALLACATAQASEWVSIGRTDDGKTEIFVDLSSIRVAGPTRRAWVKKLRAPHSARGHGVYATKWMTSDVYLNSFNCAEETMSIGVGNYYYEDGTNSVDSSIVPWSPVAPDTIGYNLLQFICALGKK
jgi:hypothetical protein